MASIKTFSSAYISKMLSMFFFSKVYNGLDKVPQIYQGNSFPQIGAKFVNTLVLFALDSIQKLATMISSRAN